MATRKAPRPFTPAMKAFLKKATVCRVASVGQSGPHVAPFCHAFDGDHTVYIETQAGKLTVRNLETSTDLVLVVDDYFDDWSKIQMLSLTGVARILTEGSEFEAAVAMLHEKFPQFAQGGMDLHFILAMDITGVRNSEGIKSP